MSTRFERKGEAFPLELVEPASALPARGANLGGPQ
jgi:hypothetical protein